jgi:membrane-associated phospholipid phosphatase
MKNLLLNKNNAYSNVNMLILSLIIIYLGIAVLFKQSIPNFLETIYELLILLIISLFIIKSIGLIKGKILKSTIQSSFVLLFFAYFFGLSSKFQLLLHNNWQDAKLIGIDNAIFGQELSLKFESIITPYLTEAMMFAYVFYLPLLIITAIVVYKSEDQKGLAEYLFVLSLSYIFCYIGFILFPVASQMYFMPEKYSVQLKGGLFTYFSELMRDNLHFRGGSLPSPHCAAATIILWASYKYNKNIFFVILPSVILLYISTVYGRFHYLMDSIIGILTGCLTIIVYPLIIRIINLTKTFFDCILHPVSIINSLGEEQTLN